MTDDDPRNPGAGDALAPELVQSLRDGPRPAASLEDRTVERLRATGLLPNRPGSPAGEASAGAPRECRPRVTPSRRGRLARALAAGIAAVLLFGAGGAVGRLTAPPPAAGEFLLLLYGPPETPGGRGGEELADEYRRWAAGLRDAGVAINGARLATQTIALAPNGRPRAPGGGSRGLLGGFFRVDARDLEAAAALAATCPHLRHGGTIEVRRISR